MKIIYVFVVLLASLHSQAQSNNPEKRTPLQVKRISAGFRLFEVDGFGNNPTTIAPLLKKPAPYQQYINSLSWNSFYGNPAPQYIPQYYINAEWFKSGTDSRFWKRYAIQAGLSLSSKVRKSGTGIGNEGWYWEDTTKYQYLYKPTQVLQFAGANLGLNRRSHLSKKLSFVTGLHLQGSVAVHHVFKQQWDSSTFHASTAEWKTAATTYGPDLKGKQYFQWQAMIPLGLEMQVYKDQFFVRADVYAGIIGGHYQSAYRASWEANGIGLWLIYQPRKL